MRGEKRGRGAVFVPAVVLAAAILAGVARAAPAAGFLHVRTDLSGTSARMSAYPDLAVSPDGNWVAVAWVEEYKANIGYRGHVYLRAASETGNGWGATVPVFSGSDSACAYYRASVVVAGATAHLAYVVFDNTCDTPQYTRVYYQTCDLTSGQCGSRQQVAYAEAPDYQITWVDLALDTSDNPHVVWTEHYVPSGPNGTVGIWYNTRSGGVWGGGEMVSVDMIDKNIRPAIAWGGGYAHVVWEKEYNPGTGKGAEIWYRRRAAGGVWDPGLILFGPYTSHPPRNPDVAAGAGRVFVVWDALYDEYDDTYALLYRRSNLDGASFLPFQGVGDDISTWGSLTEYELTGEDYLPYLQPAITLDISGWPTVVWHTAHPEGAYAVYYSYAVTGSDTNVSWIAPAVLRQGEAGAAAVGVGEPPGERHLHVAYMEALSATAWDVFYDSNEGDCYRYIYLPLVLKNASSE
jgi:hypothetical protein